MKLNIKSEKLMISWRRLSHKDISVSSSPPLASRFPPWLPASFPSFLLLLWRLLPRGPRGCRFLLSRRDYVAGGSCRWARGRAWSGGGRGAAGRLTGITGTEEEPKIRHERSTTRKCLFILETLSTVTLLKTSWNAKFGKLASCVYQCPASD